MDLRVSQLFIYPVKSLGGIALQASEVTTRGLRHDRRWMLVDGSGRFLSQREEARMALLEVSLQESSLRVYSKGNPEHRIEIPFLNKREVEFLPRMSVTIWQDQCSPVVYPDAIGAWFSDFLDQTCHLVYMDESVHRPVDVKYAHDQEINSFSDAYPLMMIGQGTLDDLNGRLTEPVPVNRFRPNLVFTGGDPFLEDQMHTFGIRGKVYKAVKPCARCIIPTIDQATGLKGEEPTRTLATYRLKDRKILFGQNVLVTSEGLIAVGDRLTIDVN